MNRRELLRGVAAVAVAPLAARVPGPVVDLDGWRLIESGWINTANRDLILEEVVAAIQIPSKYLFVPTTVVPPDQYEELSRYYTTIASKI